MLNMTLAGKKTPLAVWDKIEIIIDRDGEEGLYVTRIEDIGQDVILASKPEYVRGRELLVDNARVYVRFLKPDAMYRFQAKIKQIHDDTAGHVSLHVLSGVERVQRRNFVRVDLNIDLKYSLLKGRTSGLKLNKSNWVGSFTWNVSGGGMLMKVNKEINAEDILLVRIGEYLTLGVPRLLAVFCWRIITINENRFAGVEFITREKLHRHFTQTEMTKLPTQTKCFDVNIQNRLVRYIFDLQVRERQKGLL